ncbi:hypothetical protein BLNAU_7761 [Blattamonas nauphoetae]|uniref:Uncharacterized protein n=1 Tax=Blattamonas nauphoetae TaxID=2049346 RepID=A0ABQ9Y097_9EUKA|nr:hypothetical protein BLNAU_7761 [Blattamonas nauphoetae]
MPWNVSNIDDRLPRIEGSHTPERTANIKSFLKKTSKGFHFAILRLSKLFQLSDSLLCWFVHIIPSKIVGQRDAGGNPQPRLM